MRYHLAVYGYTLIEGDFLAKIITTYEIEKVVAARQEAVFHFLQIYLYFFFYVCFQVLIGYTAYEQLVAFGVGFYTFGYLFYYIQCVIVGL